MNDGTRDAAKRRRRIIGLLSFILIISLSLFISVCAWYFKSFECVHVSAENSSGSSNIGIPSGYDFNLGLHSTIFMLSEIGLLIIQAFHALLICSLAQIHASFRNSADALEKEHLSASTVHAINYRLDLVALVFDLVNKNAKTRDALNCRRVLRNTAFNSLITITHYCCSFQVHHVHMLICCNLFLSMTSLIVSLQMRARVRQIHSVLKKRQSFMWLSEHIDK